MKRAIGLIFIFLFCIAGFLTLKGDLPFTPIFGRSMEPTLHSGSLLIIKTINPGDIKVGDIIIYNIPISVRDYYNYPATITRRVTEIKNAPTPGFITKGDNTGNDPFTVRPMDIRGIVSGQVPFLGLLFFFFQSYQGLISVVTVLILLTIFLYSGELLRGAIVFRRRYATHALTQEAASGGEKIPAPEQNYVQAVVSESTHKIPIKLETTAIKIEQPAQAIHPSWHNMAIEEKDIQVDGNLSRQLPNQYIKKMPVSATGIVKTAKETAKIQNQFENEWELPKEAVAAEQEIFSALDRLRNKA